jgi:hypothetical protein
MTELVFGIDHGNGNMKSQSVCIPCGLVRYSSEPGRFMQEQPEAGQKMASTDGKVAPSMDTLKADIMRELLQDRVFIEKVMACVKEQMGNGESIDTTEQELPVEADESMENEESGELMDFDEDMLLSGMAMFEA